MATHFTRPGHDTPGRVTPIRAVPCRIVHPARPRPAAPLTAGRTARVGAPTMAGRRVVDPQAEVVAQAVSAALASITVLADTAGSLADVFRWEQSGPAVGNLRRLIVSIGTLVDLSEAAARAASNGRTTVDLDAHPAGHELNDALERIGQAHADADWPMLADALDIDLVDALAAWRGLVESLLPAPPSGYAA